MYTQLSEKLNCLNKLFTCSQFPFAFLLAFEIYRQRISIQKHIHDFTPLHCTLSAGVPESLIVQMSFSPVQLVLDTFFLCFRKMLTEPFT